MQRRGQPRSMGSATHLPERCLVPTCFYKPPLSACNSARAGRCNTGTVRSMEDPGQAAVACNPMMRSLQATTSNETHQTTPRSIKIRTLTTCQCAQNHRGPTNATTDRFKTCQTGSDHFKPLQTFPNRFKPLQTVSKSFKPCPTASNRFQPLQIVSNRCKPVQSIRNKFKPFKPRETMQIRSSLLSTSLAFGSHRFTTSQAFQIVSPSVPMDTVWNGLKRFEKV